MKTKKWRTQPKRVTSNLIIRLIIDITCVLRSKEQKMGVLEIKTRKWKTEPKTPRIKENIFTEATNESWSA